MGRVKTGAVKDTLLFGLIREFLDVYLPTQRNSSPHTKKSYKFAIDSFLDFVKLEKNITLAAVTFDMLDSKTLSAYLDDVEANGGSMATRNHRLTGIRAFFAYAAKIEPITVIRYDEICKVPVKKSKEPKAVNYMSEAAVTAILSRTLQRKRGCATSLCSLSSMIPGRESPRF